MTLIFRTWRTNLIFKISFGLNFTLLLLNRENYDDQQREFYLETRVQRGCPEVDRLSVGRARVFGQKKNGKSSRRVFEDRNGNRRKDDNKDNDNSNDDDDNSSNNNDQPSCVSFECYNGSDRVF